ncbi:MAG: CehA/McbA family metallohydrolase, partial [Acidobacteriota bacterium]
RPIGRQKKIKNFLQKGQIITAIASSDSHFPPYEPSPYPNNLRIGEPSVFIGAKSLNETSLFAGIKVGRVFMAENPRYSVKFTANQNKTIGDKVLVRKNQKVNLKVSLEGFSNDAKVLWISDGKLIKESAPNSNLSYTFSTDKNNYVRLEIRNKDGKMLAMTNPIYFRVK